MLAKNVQSLLTAYAENDFRFIADFIKTAPKNASTDSSLMMLTSEDSFFAVCAIDGVAAAFTHGGNYEQGLLFGIASYETANHYCFKLGGTRKEEMIYYAASSSYLVTKCYLDTAKYADGIKFYERTKMDYNNYFDNPDFISLKLNAVELYLQTTKPEEARNVFLQINTNNIPYSARINYDRLQSKLQVLFTDATVIPEEMLKTNAAFKVAEVQGMLDALNTMMLQSGSMETEETKQIEDMIGGMKNSIAYMSDDDKRNFETATSIYDTIYGHLKTIGGGTDLTLAELRQQLQKSQAIFVNDATAYDPPSLQTSLTNLQQLLPQFEKYIDETNDTLWSIQICQKRLSLFDEGANTLEQLRVNLEHKREVITNIKERAGVFTPFKYLFPNLVELYYKSKNAKGVLKAMEASKGRLLADAILKQTDNEISINNYDIPVERLPGLLSLNKAHYISFFVDDEYSISALVTANGRYYAEYIPIGKITMQQWVADHLDDPKEWKGKGAKGLFGKKTDIPQLLGKFLNILNIAAGDNNLQPGDHLVYSPDEMMFLFPLQYALLNNQYLIEQFSLSRIHNCYQLVNILEQKAVKIKSLVCCTAPAEQDMSDHEKIKRFSEVKTWLDKNMPDNTSMEYDTVPELLNADHNNSIIHFSTHGVFPTPGMEADKANPYYNSGLLLKNGTVLPALQVDFNYYLMDNFLNPQKLFESGRNWQHNHITLQACVSGRSKEGVGGDALGMESAAFFCGAASLLTAGWNISLQWGNRFCILFYNYWLVKKLTRGAAYQKAMLDLLKDDIPTDFPPAYYWAGMTLSGDWR